MRRRRRTSGSASDDGIDALSPDNWSYARSAPQTKVASTPAETAGESTQNKAIDIIREWDPAKAEAYLKVNTNPWTNGVLDIKTIELICVGLNAACTNLQPEPTRRHIRAALQAGATRHEIQLVIEGAAFMAIHSCSLGAPMLLEEGKAAGKTPTVKKVTTPSADMMKAKGLWNTAWDPFFNLDPLWTDQFFAAVGGIYDGKTLQPKFVELLSIALDASVTHMYAPGTRRHIKGALALGATMEEIMETLKIATSFGQRRSTWRYRSWRRKLLHSRRRNSLVAPKRVSAHWRTGTGAAERLPCLGIEVLETSALPHGASGNSQRVSALRRRVTASGWEFETVCARRIVPRTNKRLNLRGKLEAPPGFEPGMEVLQISRGSLS